MTATSQLEKLDIDAGALHRSERLKLACNLLESADEAGDEADPDAEALWEAEIDKRR